MDGQDPGHLVPWKAGSCDQTVFFFFLGGGGEGGIVQQFGLKTNRQLGHCMVTSMESSKVSLHVAGPTKEG